MKKINKKLIKKSFNSIVEAVVEPKSVDKTDNPDGTNDNKDNSYISDKYLLTYFDSKKLYEENIETFNSIIKNKFKNSILQNEKDDFINKATYF